MATKVLIIAGGLTHERDVSVRSGRRVANILTQCGYVVRISDVDASLAEAIESFSPDVVWPLVHGSIGEDGSLQSFLESVGIPFVGSSSVQAMLASNKPTAKALLGSAGLATPGWVTLPQAIFRQLGASHVLSALEGSVSFPVVIKPTDGGSALGISTAQDAKALRRAMVDAFAYGQRLMVEQRINGRDVAVSVIDLWDGPVALPPVEVSTDRGRYDYDARYTTDETEYFVPARLSDELLADLQAAAVEAHTTLFRSPRRQTPLRTPPSRSCAPTSSTSWPVAATCMASTTSSTTKASASSLTRTPRRPRSNRSSHAPWAREEDPPGPTCFT